MMRLLFLLVMFLLGPGFALAETFRSVVRSGAHDGFTRLVLKVPDQVKWNVATHGQAATISVDSPDIIFDTSKVFSRIGKQHLLALRQVSKEGDLQLDLACRCDISGFMQDNSFLVIDIREPKRTLWKSREKFFPKSGVSYRFNMDEVRSVEETAGVERTFALNGGYGRLALDSTVATMQENKTTSPTLVLPFNIKNQEFQKSNDNTEKYLDGLLSRALNQGVLQPKTNTVATEDYSGLSALEGELSLVENINASTVIDRDFQSSLEGTAARPSDVVCLSEDITDINLWINDGATFDRVSEIRSEIFGEFDVLDEEKIKQLARLYIYLGFGAEAEQVLQILPENNVEATVLPSLAKIVDGRKVDYPSPFQDQSACPGSGALWTVLAAGQISDRTDTESVLRSFASLPSHLRENLGPKLSRMFVDHGNKDAAEAVLRAVARLGGEPTSDLSLAQAEIAGLSGRSTLEDEKLIETVNSADINSVEALVRLIGKRWEVRKPLTPDVSDLISSYALEYRKDALGPEVRQAEIIALGMAGDFESVFERLAIVREIDGRSHVNTALVPALFALTEQADDVTFLRHAFQVATWESWPEEANVILALARRLSKMGFSGPARDFLEKAHFSDDERKEASLLLGQTALDLDLPHRAMIDLLGVQGREASRIRAQAMMLNGDFSDAANLFVQNEDVDQALRSVWHSGEKPENLGNVSGRYGGFVSLSDALIDPVGVRSDLPPLASAHELVAESMSIRQNLRELLQDTPAR
ncbi:hypothetical protein K3727_00520 [Rhodobacteraceae bacterium M382]|nr:hypothetical protein K3727_00520 [Rhodobacteraceae bacterium M382]